MLRDLMPCEANPDDPLWTTNIMTYELGSVIKSLVYARHKEVHGEGKSMRAHLANARIEFADLITQCQVLAEQMEWNWLELKNDGRERFEERMRELEDGTL